ncbi:MAG: hypothetical protein SNJ72_10705 [Fimbriimonadales bacterium]
MMRNLWSLGSLVVLILSTSLAHAQQQGTQAGSERIQTPSQQQQQAVRGDVLAPANLSRELNLTEEQRARIEGLWKQYNDRNETIRRDTSLTQEQRILRLRQNREEYVRLVRSVLKPEQLKRFEQLLEEQSPALSSLQGLRFTPQQMEKVREISQRYSKLRQQISADSSLDPTTRSRRLQELNKQMMDEIRGILTAQQREQWDKAMKRDKEKENEKEKDDKEKKSDN